MTSDAKVGLLLGLAFIVIIAFLINGLPSFLNSTGTEDELRTSVDDYGNKSVVIGQQAVEAVKIVNITKEPFQSVPVRVTPDHSDIRFALDLPKKQDAESAASYTGRKHAKTYIVESGDNLAVIAKKVYGSDLGNKNAVIQRIYKANRDILSSPDRVSVGLELEIPSLSQKNEKTMTASSNGMIEKLKNMTSKSIAVLKNTTISHPSQSEYIVREGDSLWQIASKLLGDGTRYHEIVKMNDEIDNVDDLYVGMTLELPNR